MSDDQTMPEGTSVIPVLTIEREADAVPLAKALLTGGLRVLEVTLRTSAGAGAARAILREVPEAIVALGTVTTPRDVSLAAELGVAFAFSPGATPALLRASRDFGVRLVPGVQSASDLMLCAEYGIEMVKFFPAASAGGPAALRTLTGPFPRVRFCPTGGISEATASDWLAMPCVFAVGGSWIAPPEDVAAWNWRIITERAARGAMLSSRG